LDEKLEDKDFNYALNEEISYSNKIRISHLNSEERKSIMNLIISYGDLQFVEGDNLTFTHTIKHIIKTKHESPVYVKPYRYPYIYRDEVEKQKKELISQGIVRKSSSPYCNPIWIVPKKDNASETTKFRLVIDYRHLKNITISDKFPIPNIDEISDKLRKCQYFSTLDLAKGFHQIEMDPESIEKTAFSTQNGHYEYTRMPFGLKNAPATCQRCMNEILKDLIGVHCLVYLDDIVIFSTSLQEHNLSIFKVFDKLREAYLKLHLEKCEFLKRKTNFLGHIITPNCIKPNPSKIKAILDFFIPKTCGFYKKFIKTLLKLLKLLQNA